MLHSTPLPGQESGHPTSKGKRAKCGGVAKGWGCGVKLNICTVCKNVQFFAHHQSVDPKSANLVCTCALHVWMLICLSVCVSARV